MKVVIDTNIFVSSFFGGKPRKIIELWKNRSIILCISGEIIDEYIEVLQRMGLRDENELQELLVLFAQSYNCLFTAKTPALKIIKSDPDDDKFIECAVALNAQYIITGDKEVLDIKNYMGIKVVTPNQFLEEFDNFKN
jgi:putative PIN family toxin of toxin-antitoxin system